MTSNDFLVKYFPIKLLFNVIFAFAGVTFSDESNQIKIKIKNFINVSNLGSNLQEAKWGHCYILISRERHDHAREHACVLILHETSKKCSVGGKQ